MKRKPTKILAFLIGFFITLACTAVALGLASAWDLPSAIVSFVHVPQESQTVSVPPAGAAIRSASPFQPLPSPTITQTTTQTKPFTATPTATPTRTTTVTMSSTPTITETIAPSHTITTTLLQEMETAIPTIPVFAFIDGYRGQPQMFSLDCEARSAVDLAAFWGIHIDEIEFLGKLPRSDDPNEGFVGDFEDPWGDIPPASYGVYANPIARVLRGYGLSAYARTGMTLEELQQEIAAGRPVIVWVIGQVEPGVPFSYIPANGNRTTVAHNEHTVTVIGYDDTFIYVIDPAFSQFYMRKTDLFLDSWGVLDFMAVITE